MFSRVVISSTTFKQIQSRKGLLAYSRSVFARQAFLRTMPGGLIGTLGILSLLLFCRARPLDSPGQDHQGPFAMQHEHRKKKKWSSMSRVDSSAEDLSVSAQENIDLS
jgi:hypothetical protein